MTILKIYKPEDSEEANAVSTLYEGEHFVGRDKLSDCHDKRVSRKHALIQVRADGVTLTAVHVNPCYFKSSNENLIQVVRKDCTVTLQNADQFSLLMDLCWYKVKVISSNDITPQDTTSVNPFKELKRGLDHNEGNDTCKRLKTCNVSDQTVSVTPAKVSNIDANGLIKSLNIIINEDYGRASTSTSLLQNGEKNRHVPSNSEVSKECPQNNNEPDRSLSGDNIQSNEQPSKTTAEKPAPSVPSNELVNEDINIQQEISPHASVPYDVVHVKVKEEVVETESDSFVEQIGDNLNVTCNPSESINLACPDDTETNVNFNSSTHAVPNTLLSVDNIKKEAPDKEDNNSQNGDTTGPSSSSGKNKTWRDRCWYGHSCYRKNPTHRSNLSHPGDEDYDSDSADDRPACPFGATCYRVNMEHRRKFKHLGRPAPKPANVNVQINVNRNCPFCSHCGNNNYRKPGYESDHDSDGANEL
ncbi:aprataxin and PNK-like factor [Leptinotarsa decemlineata]|uniref:aprataxin and PNK-like factor n=1 Tax=Leptinotarsa decemlineata TaxID=7539 RepID=UPI003D30D3F1